jgi:hypothetical protein
VLLTDDDIPELLLDEDVEELEDDVPELDLEDIEEVFDTPEAEEFPSTVNERGKRAFLMDPEKSERLEGINPRFLRAAAKLEKARISQVSIAETAREDEEAWRRQLEESSSGSVISFLPPDKIREPGKLQGFPKNQPPMEPPLPQLGGDTSNSIPPPPPPAKRK